MSFSRRRGVRCDMSQTGSGTSSGKCVGLEAPEDEAGEWGGRQLRGRLEPSRERRAFAMREGGMRARRGIPVLCVAAPGELGVGRPSSEEGGLHMRGRKRDWGRKNLRTPNVNAMSKNTSRKQNTVRNARLRHRD